MKKLVMLMAVMLGFVAVAEPEVVDVYAFKANIKTPYLNKGVRDYANRSFKGFMYVEYDTAGDKVSACTIYMTNQTTKVGHVVVMGEAMYNLLGKSNKYSTHIKPTVYFDGADTEVTMGTGKGAQEPHEFITEINLAGSGSIKYKKTVNGVVSCNACCGFVDNTTAQFCNKLASMSGNLTGKMDCECPEDEDWDHTVEAGSCGVIYNDEGKATRTHFASFWGSWSATWKEKLSRVNN